MSFRIITLFTVLIFSFAFAFSEDNEEKILNNTTETLTPSKSDVESSKINIKIKSLYDSFAEKNVDLPSFGTFERGMMGYTKLLDEGLIKNNILTLVDFSLSSTKKRMWIMDMTTDKILFNTYVAHGQNTGGEFATNFSNTVNSFQSSLGFYVTGETYYGKNGLSLFIDGQEKRYNSRARERYVVIHGADYATPEFINKNGRLGRSLGCPAVPMDLAHDVINTIKGESVVYIHQEDEDYVENSSFINQSATSNSNIVSSNL